MLKSITLRFTERPEPVIIPTEGVTIFVGPNNSGKSLALREIERALISGQIQHEGKLVSDFDVRMPNTDQLQADIELLRKKSPIGLSPDQVYIGRFLPNGSLDSNTVAVSDLQSQVARSNKQWFTSNFWRFFQIRLDGRTRFDLTNDRSTGDLLAIPQNILVHLFQDDELRKQVRDIIHDAFGVYFVIDPLSGGNLRIRLSQTPPTHDEQSLGKPARDFHSKAIHIQQASDGVQAFVGIVITVQSGDYRVTLIDEPEAFLHPPLARKLGYQLAKTALNRGGSLIAATHSPDFLMGCLQASSQVRVVRMEYSNAKSKGQIVNSDALRKFFTTPLMRSANVISGLFHDGVVITESDNDRAFYSEIYHRLAEQASGSPSLLFVNAQNKQTIQDILGPLRAFGVAATAIVDIDILKDGGATWTGWLKACQIPTVSHHALGQHRGDLHRLFTDKGVNMKDEGVTGLKDSAAEESANGLFDTLERYGVFVTRKGELETWLRHLNVSGKKTDWTIAMLQRLGADPAAADYVNPAAGDVWDFLRSIIDWVKDPARKGTT
jgi:ABC-type cobalamin/Fe3+-siderophores transport system ATPase subunit